MAESRPWHGCELELTVIPAYAHCSLFIFVPQSKQYFWDNCYPFQPLLCYSHFFQSRSPCLRPPVLKSPGHHLPYCPTGLGSSSPILTWSSMTTRHLVHDRGLGQCNGCKEGRWAHFYKCFLLPLQAACLP